MPVNRAHRQLPWGVLPLQTGTCAQPLSHGPQLQQRRQMVLQYRPLLRQLQQEPLTLPHPKVRLLPQLERLLEGTATPEEDRGQEWQHLVDRNVQAPKLL